LVFARFKFEAHGRSPLVVEEHTASGRHTGQQAPSGRTAVEPAAHVTAGQATFEQSGFLMQVAQQLSGRRTAFSSEAQLGSAQRTLEQSTMGSQRSQQKLSRTLRKPVAHVTEPPFGHVSDPVLVQGLAQLGQQSPGKRT
jgi:hypothetical protein